MTKPSAPRKCWLHPDNYLDNSPFKKALNDPVAAVNYPEERAWVRKYHLYQMLDAREDLRSAHPALAAFYNSSSTANTGKLWQAHNALQVGQSGLAAVEAQGQLASVSAELKPERALQNLLQIMVDNVTHEQYSIDTVLYQAQQHLQNLLGTDFQELPEPEMRIRKLNQEQYATVAELAEQCPYQYGPAVYMARAARLRNDRYPRPYANACEDSRSGKRGEDGVENLVEERSYSLYPNPNTGEFTVALDLQEGETAQIQVWSLAGQLVHSEFLDSGTNDMKIDAAKGLYLYSIVVNDGTRWTGKVSISSQ